MNVIIDANILWYYLRRSEPYFEKVSKFLSDVVENKYSGLISLTTLREIIYVAKRKNITNKMIIRFLKKLDELPNIDIISPTIEVMTKALQIEKNNVGYSDSELTAFCLLNMVEGIVTANESDFKEYNIKIINPTKI